MKVATDFLGRPFRLSGKVIEGEKIGRTIGFPTANIDIKDYVLACPGVYAVRVKLPRSLKKLS